MATDTTLVSLRDATRELGKREWTPSVELAQHLTAAAAHALELADGPREMSEVRDGLLLAQELFELRGAEMVEGNLIVAQRIRTEWKIGQALHAAALRGGDRKSKYHDDTLIRLRDIGISRRDSMNFQNLAELDLADLETWMQEKLNEDELSTAWALKLWKQYHADERAEPTAEEVARAAATLDDAPLLGDFKDVAAEIPDGSIDCIITDPPYEQVAIGDYGALSDLAGRVLRPGGSLVVMTGQYHLPAVLLQLVSCEEMHYHWTAAYLTPGGQSPQIWPCRVNTFWKPLIWLVKGEYEGPWIGDVCKSEVNDNDKRYHDWGQSESGMKEVVERFSLPGEIILDPFMGAGTTGVVALQLGRRFKGIERDEDTLAVATVRLGKVRDAILQP